MHRVPPVLLVVVALTAGVAISTPAHAQCTYTWPPAPFAGGVDATVHTLALTPDGDVLAGGAFTLAGAQVRSRIARWNGTTWTAFGSGADADVRALRVLPNGDVLAGGSFTAIGGSVVNHVARWSAGAWSALGNGIDAALPLGASVQALAVLGNGDIVAGGSFASASGVPASNIARWDGSVWSPLGGGCNGTVRALAVAAGGELYATGSFTTAGGVHCNGIARWNGSAWSALGTGLGVFGGNAIAVLAGGDIVAGGTFVTAGGAPAARVARWHGTGWAALGAGTDGPVTALLALPDGGLVAAGAFTQAGGAPAAGIARWNGTAWTALDSGPGGNGVAGTVHALVQLPGSAVVAGGTFTATAGGAAGRIARVDSSCAPTAVVLGTGCTGGGGLNTLVATRLPQLGGTFAATATGMPPFAFVLAVTGLGATSLPLVAVLPQAYAGCTLLATPDLVDVLLPLAGGASSSLAFPAAPALLAVTFFHQYVPLELDAGFAITGVSATNAVQVTIGTF